jgi:hypothetical protein
MERYQRDTLQRYLVEDTTPVLEEERVRELGLFLSGPGETLNTAEFHDCQAFISDSVIGDPDRFSDGIFAIFAVRHGDAPVSSQPLFQTAETSMLAKPAAQIFALDTYASLGILPGFSCLYLYGSEDSYEARLRYDGRYEQDCSDDISVEDFHEITSVPLTVAVSDPPQDEEPVSAPVAVRWHWHSHFDGRRGLQQYKMGVWCDGRWCEVGNPGTHGSTGSFASATLADPEAAFDGPAADQVLQTSQGQLPGWYDEQILADYRDNSLGVSSVVGTIIPEPGLGEYDDARFAGEIWLPAAKVALTSIDRLRSPTAVQDPEKNPYRLKFGFNFTEVGSPLNSVFLCRGDAEKCFGDEDLPPSFELPVCDEEMVRYPENDQWWAKIQPGGEQVDVYPHYHCAARCDYGFMKVPGTARWRWLPDDDGIWVRCIEGCCEVRGNGEGW